MEKKILGIIAFTALIGTSCSSESANALSGEDPATETFVEGEAVGNEAAEATAEINWVLTFEDDFEGDSREPDPSKWILCERGNDSWNRYLSGSYNQAYQQDGILYLIAERKDGEYLTGGIETRGKYEFEHGKVECRARFARTPHGNHTGIWMMPAPPAETWPRSGEIDIMEHLSDESQIYETVHSWYADDMGHKDDPAAQKVVEISDIEGWHVYGLEWNSQTITYTVDGTPYLSYPNLGLEGENGTLQWPFNHPFYLILSQSLGGEGTWAGYIDNSALPAIFEIDWIKVWQDADSNEASVPQIRL